MFPERVWSNKTPRLRTVLPCSLHSLPIWTLLRQGLGWYLGLNKISSILSSFNNKNTVLQGGDIEYKVFQSFVRIPFGFFDQLCIMFLFKISHLISQLPNIFKQKKKHKKGGILEDYGMPYRKNWRHARTSTLLRNC